MVAGGSSHSCSPLQAVRKSRRGLTAAVSQPERERERLQSHPCVGTAANNGGGRGRARRLRTPWLRGLTRAWPTPLTAQLSHGWGAALEQPLTCAEAGPCPVAKPLKRGKRVRPGSKVWLHGAHGRSPAHSPQRDTSVSALTQKMLRLVLPP